LEVASVTFNNSSHNFSMTDKVVTENMTYGPFKFQVLQNCSQIVDLIKKHVKSKKVKNRYELMELDEVAFYMVGDNETKVLRALDDIRIKRNKFICLNDNMNRTNVNEKVIDALHAFYESLVPSPSSFELPEGKLNPYLHLNELLEDSRKKLWNLLILFLAGVIIFSVIVYLASKRARKQRFLPGLGSGSRNYDV